MANLGNTIVNGILKVNGKVNVGESVTAPSFIGNLTGNADTATKAVRLMGIENRDIKPSVVPNDSVVGYFASKSGLEGSALQTDYVDVLTFNTWHNNSGGKLNALAFKKNGSQALYHYSADYGATTWGTPKQIAYTDSNITGNAATATKLATARNINGVAFDGTKDITINSSDSTKLPLAGGTMTGTISTALNGSWLEGFNGTKSIIKSTSAGAAHTSLFSAASTNGRFQIFKYTNYMGVCYESNANISAGNNGVDNGVYFNEAGTLYPSNNNVQTLGTSTMKWNNVYATNFTGLASNATSDASGNNIVNTYLRKDSVDSALSSTSLNPVQNKVINTALAGKATNVNLNGKCQRTSYRRSVIALCQVSTTNDANFDSYSAGNLYFHRTNGLSGVAYIKFTIENQYSQAYHFNYNYLSNLQFNSSTSAATGTGFRPCTFKYNNVYYAGFEVFIGDAEYSFVDFIGKTNFNIFALDYYDTNAKTALNTEVYNSLNYTQADVKYQSTYGTFSGALTGNAATATKLQTARTIGVSGVTGTAQSFNGTANIVIPITAVPASLLTGKTAIKGSEITNDKHWVPSSDDSVKNFVAMTTSDYATNASSLATGTIVAITDGVEGYVTTQATSLTCDLPLDL